MGVKFVSKNAFIITIITILLAAVLFAGTTVSLKILRNKVDIVLEEDGKNPYLYNEKLLTIQKKLNRVLAFNLTNYAPIEESGFWGTETEKALDTFQEMYYKKYHLQRYYAFSASGGSIDLNSAEGLINKELPTPANFLQENLDRMKLKAGDPAQYYGNSAMDEIRRIEKGLGGGLFVDPVTGELSKTVSLYQTPLENTHLIPIQLSARYGSQYAGNSGLGNGWYMTENSSIWFSFEKNELIIQDGKGISQKFYFNYSKKGFFRSTNENTDGGYFLEPAVLEGDLGDLDSRITVTNRAGEVMEFLSINDNGQSSVSNVLDAINKSRVIYGYTVMGNLNTTNATNYVTTAATNIQIYSYGVQTNISVSIATNISAGYLEKGYSKGILGTAEDQVDFNNHGTQTLGYDQMVCDKPPFIERVKALGDGTNGWSVSFYEAADATWRTNIFNFGLSAYAKFSLTNYTREFSGGSITNFRRSGGGQPNVYAGYVLADTVNRYGSRKEYQYNSYQKLRTIDTYSPGGSLVDQAVFTYMPDSKDGKVSLIQLFNKNAVKLSEVKLDYNADFLETLTQFFDGKTLAYQFQYENYTLAGANSPEMIKLRQGLYDSKTNLEAQVSSYQTFYDLIVNHKGDLINLTNTVNKDGYDPMKNLWSGGVSGMQAWMSSNLGNIASYRYSAEYYDIMLQYIPIQMDKIKGDISSISGQIADYDSGKYFKNLPLLKSSSENQKNWIEADYKVYETNRFNVTNLEASVRATGVKNAYGKTSFDYNSGQTLYSNLKGDSFTFNYDRTLTNYNDRRVKGIVYPDKSSVYLAYNSKGDITAVTNEVNNTYSYSYDGAGNMTNKTLPGNRTWSYVYDLDNVSGFIGNPSRIIQPDGSEYRMVYDGLGDVVSQTLMGPDGSQTLKLLSVETIPSSDGFIKKNTDQYGEITTISYDYNFNTTTVTNPDGGVTAFTRDDFGRTLTESHSWNGANLVTYYNIYDTRGNIVEQGIKGGDSVSSNTYNEFGQKIEAVDPFGNKVKYGFDTGGRLVSVNYPDRNTVGYSYNAEGNKTADTYPDGKSIVYQYDSKGQMTDKIQFDAGQTNSYSYSYDAVGNLTNQKAIGRGFALKDNTFANAYCGDTVLDRTYQYDGIGLLKSETDNLSGKNTFYSYTPMGLLKRLIKSDASGDTYAKSFHYDLLGRQLSLSASKDNVNWTLLVSNIYLTDLRATVKIDQYGNYSTNFYDSRNNITNLTYAVFDPVSNQNVLYSHSYAFDSMGNKVSEIFPDGSMKQWVYTNGNWLVWEAKPFNNGTGPESIVTNIHDKAGRVTSVQDGNRLWKRNYDAMGYVSDETDPENRITRYRRDVFGNPVQIMVGIKIKTVKYNLFNKPVEVDYPEGTVDLTYYDALGNASAMVYGGNSTLKSLAGYDSEGIKTWQSDPNGLVTSWDYDCAGNNTVIKKQCLTVSNTIKQSVWINEYDLMGRLTKETLPDNSSVGHGYFADKNGLLVEAKTAGQRTETNYYDQLNRNILSIIADENYNLKSDYPFFTRSGAVNGKIYNRAGLPVTEFLPNGSIRTHAYNAEGKVIAETNEAGESAAYSYDRYGEITDKTDYDGNQYRFEYDGTGKQVKTVFPDGGEQTVRYDIYGNMDRQASPDGSYTAYDVNSRGQTVKETNPLGGSSTYTYNELGQITLAVNPSGAMYSNEYVNGTLVRSIAPGSKDGEYFITGYSINAFGQTNLMTAPDNGKVRFHYNALGRLTKKTVESNSYSYFYTPEGYFAGSRNPDESGATNFYSASGLLLSSASITNGVKCRETKYSYGTDDDGHSVIYGKPWKIEDWQGITKEYLYDSAGRVLREKESVAQGTESRTTIYTYGKTNINGIFYRTVENYRLDGEKPVNWNLTVKDFRGNTVQEWKKFAGESSPVLVTTREYNKAGKIVSETRQIDKQKAAVTESVYNAAGYLQKKTEPSGLVTVYDYDTSERVISKNESGRVTTYEYCPSGSIGRIKTMGSGNSILKDESYVYDYRGNVTLKTDNLSGKTEQSVFDKFGNKVWSGVQAGGETRAQAWVYDWAGRSTVETNEAGGVTSYTYDLLGQKTGSITGASGDSNALITRYSYDSRGDLLEESRRGTTIENGKNVIKEYTTTYAYDAWQNRTNTVYPDGSAESMVYDIWGRKTGSIDRYGYSSTVYYDINGRTALKKAEAAGGALSLSNAYDYDGNVVMSVTTPNPEATSAGRTVYYEYDNAGNKVRETLLNGGSKGNNISRDTGYDVFGTKLWETDFSGNKAYYFYDELGRTVKTIDREGNTAETSYSYESGGLIVKNISSGITTAVKYNGFGDKVQVTDGPSTGSGTGGYSDYFEYNSLGKVTKAVDRSGNTNFFYYDSLGRNTAAIDPYGKSISNVYDSFGSGAQVIDKDGHGLYREYDWAGRVVNTIDALSNRAIIKYSIGKIPNIVQGMNGRCEIEQTIDAESNSTTVYKLGKQTFAIVDSLGNTTRYVYDPYGQMTQTVDARDNTRVLTYDKRGNKVSEENTLGFVTTYQFDDNGNLMLEKNGEGTITTAYNKNNQPVSKTYSDGNKKVFTYDSLGRLTEAADKFSDYSYTYDNTGLVLQRLDRKTQESISYTYYPNGSRKSMTAAGKTVNYAYNALNSIARETVLTGAVTNLQVLYLYSAMGMITNKRYSTGVKTAYIYDSINRLKRIENYTNKSQFLSSLDYSYDKVGNRTNEIETTGDSNGNKSVRTSSFKYNPTYQLVSADYGSTGLTTSGEGHFEKFTYDSCYNRLTKADETGIIHYVTDSEGRLLCEQIDTITNGQTAKSVVSYYYDQAGRIVKKIFHNASATEKTEYYKWNCRDLMTQIRVEKADSTVMTSYLYDVNNLRIKKSGTSDAAGSMDEPDTTFTYDTSDELLTENNTFYLSKVDIKHSIEGEILSDNAVAYLKDGIDSIRGEIYLNPIILPRKNQSNQENTSLVSNPDTNKKINVKTFAYKAFGESLISGDSQEEQWGLGFASLYLDKESKLFYCVARYYAASSGRFLSPDGITDPAKRYSPAGLAVYIWAFNNPLSFYDPTGLWSIGLGIVISWDPTHGFGIGVGAAFDFSKEIGLGVNASIVNYADNSTSYTLGAQLALSTIALSAKVGLGMSYNTKSGTNFYANAGFSVAGLGVMAGTSQTWDASGNYIGGTTNVKGFVGDVFSNVGVGYQWGQGAYEGQTGAYVEAESYGNSARMGFYQDGAQFNASMQGFSMSADKNGARLTGFTEQVYGYQIGEEKNEYTINHLDKFTGILGEFINFSVAMIKNQMRINEYKKLHTSNESSKLNVTAQTPSPTKTISIGDNNSAGQNTASKQAITPEQALQFAANTYDRADMDLGLPEGSREVTEKEMRAKGIDPDQFYDVDSNMKAKLFVTKDGQYVLAYQGTQNLENGGLRDWVDNYLQAAGFETEKYKKAIKLADDLNRNKNISGNLTITGHSLGGGLASAAGYVTKARTITFDAAGVNYKTVGAKNEDNLIKNTKNITAYDVKGEILWSLQETLHSMHTLGLNRDDMPTALGNRIIVDPVMPMEMPFYDRHATVEMMKALLNR